MTSLIRILDNLTATLSAEEYAAFSKGGTVLPIEFFVYTKWGGGQGDYTEELRIAGPDGDEVRAGQPIPFKLEEGHSFHQIRKRVRFDIRKAGLYALRLYANGQPVAEHSLAIHAVTQGVPPAPTQQQE